MDRRDAPLLGAFNVLSDELLLLILRKAVTPWDDSWNDETEGLPVEEIWAWARHVAQLRGVCGRFKSLMLDAAPNMDWEFGQGGDEDAPYLRAMQSVREWGPKLKGLRLVFGEPGERDPFDDFGPPFESSGIVSVPFLASLLCQGHTENLQTLVLNAPNMATQSDVASEHLLDMLVAQPALKSLHLRSIGFYFRFPLRERQLFMKLQHLRINGSVVSDAFLHSIVASASQLRNLSLENCSGLSEVALRAPNLISLDLEMVTPMDSLLLKCPELKSLHLHSEVKDLKMAGVRELYSFRMDAPVRKFEVVGGGCLPLRRLKFTRWCKVAGLKQIFGHTSGTRSLSLQSCHVSDMEAESFSTFLGRLPKQVKILELGTFAEKVFLPKEGYQVPTESYLTALEDLEVDVDKMEDFAIVRLLFSCSPSLQVATLDLRTLRGRASCLAQTITDLQAKFPRVEIRYIEGSFYSAFHIEHMDPAHLRELQRPVPWS